MQNEDSHHGFPPLHADTHHRHGFTQFCEFYGLHPLVALAMFAADWMLFVGLELPSGFLLTLVSALFGMALAIPCILIQRSSYKEEWGAAIGKGLVVAILTAIPSPLPSFVTGGWGVIGAIGLAAKQANLRKGSPSPMNQHDRRN